MLKHEGHELLAKIKEQKKKVTDIAKILEMSPQNFYHHIKKETFDAGFRRLLNEKDHLIFPVEHLLIKGQAGDFLGEIMEEIVRLKATVRMLSIGYLEQLTAMKNTPYASEEREFLKNIQAEVDRLYNELKKKR